MTGQIEISEDFFARPTLRVAPELIGKVLVVGGGRGRIVEVEAYTDDQASHGFRRTARSNIMFDTYGMVYVYFIYGMYHCLNFTTDSKHVGAVLIRALEPLSGIAAMQKRRGTESVRALCSGPGKLCSAFGIDERMNWTPVGKKVKIFDGPRGKIVSSPRIGITKAADLHWRFYEADNRFISRPARRL